MRTSRSCLLLAVAGLMSHAGPGRAQCPGGGPPDPICVPTVTSGQASSAPAPEDGEPCHYYPQPDQRQPGWDNWSRNFDPSDAAENVDAWAIDRFVAQQVASGRVDTNRIYVTGWSNGAAMGYIYGLSRPSIAAIAVYSAPDPFHAFKDPCPQVPAVNGSTPVTWHRITT